MGAIVEIGFSAVAVERGLTALQTRLSSFAAGLQKTMPNISGLLGIGGVGGALMGAGAAIKGTLGAYDDLADAMIRLQESGETLQRVEHASQLLASVDMDGVVSSFLKLEKALGDPDNAKAAEALQHLGISAQELGAMALDEKILAMSGAFQQARNSGTGYNDILALMGKSAGDLIPLLTASREELVKLMGEAAVVPDSAVAAMAQANDALDGMFARSKAGFATMVASALGAWEMLKGKSFAEAFGTPASVDSQQVAIRKQKAEQAAAQEKKRQETELAKMQEEAAKLAEKEAEDKTRRLERIRIMQDQILQLEMKRMDPAQRLTALMDLQQRRIDELRNSSGLFYEATVEGMKKFAEAQIANGSSSAEKTVSAYQEILQIQEQIVAQQAQLRDSAAGQSAEIAAAEAKAKAAENEAWWEQMISEEKERQDQFNSMQDLTMEISLLRAKAMGQTSLVTALEREQEIRRRTQEIMSRTGMGEDQARSVATSMVDMQAKADQRAARDGQGAAGDSAGRIRGYSFARQGGAYERQDHLYGAGAKFRDNQANLLREQAAKNGRETSTPGQDTSTSQTALQTIQQILTTLQGGAT